MSIDERPLPEYGEYASDSEQASAIERSGAPRPEVRPAPDAPVAPVKPVTPSARVQPTPRPERTSANSADRIVTIFLLSFGLVYIIGGAQSFLTLGASMDRMFGQLGFGDYTTTTLTPIIGIILLVCQAIIWLIATGWAYARILKGRIAWWIPVAGGILSFLVTAALLGVLLSSDPAFLSYVSSA